MKRVFLLTAAGAIALLVGTTASALTRSGKIVATDGLTGAITVQSDDGKQVVFTRNGATQLDVAKGALEHNARVTISTDQTGIDPRTPMLATRVRVDEIAAAAPAADSKSTVRVESAGKDGNVLSHTVQVESADYGNQAPGPRDHLPKTASPLPVIAALGAALLFAGLALGLRRRS
jgi:LPXTG-motif cell wall-anchored protein